MTVRTRAIDLRTVELIHPNVPIVRRNRNKEDVCNGDAHLGQLGRRSTSNLLHPEVEELSFQLPELFCQVILGPVMTGRYDATNRLVLGLYMREVCASTDMRT